MTDILDRPGAENKPWFLSGNYGPVFNEATAHNLPVTGAIPSALSGARCSDRGWTGEVVSQSLCANYKVGTKS